MVTFLRWWMIVCLTGFGCVVSAFYGFFPYLWVADMSKLSFAAFAIFTFFTAFVGQMTYKSCRGDNDFVKHLPLCWFVTELLLGLGMMGTLIGFLLLLDAAFAGGFSMDVAGIQKILASMAVGFSTAGLTTLVGLATSLILKLQLINLEYMIDEE